MDKTPGKRKQKNKKKSKYSNKKNRQPRQDIIIFFDDDENKQLTPYEIDFLKNVTQTEEEYNGFLFNCEDDQDIIFTENSFPRALNKADRKKLKRQAKRESMENIEPPESKKSPKSTISKNKPTHVKNESPLFTKFIRAQDPISQLRASEESEFEILYLEGMKPVDKEDVEGIKVIEEEIAKLSIEEHISIETVEEEEIISIETVKEDTISIEIPNKEEHISIKTVEEEEDTLFNPEKIQFKDILINALEETKLNLENEEDKEETLEVIFDLNEPIEDEISDEEEFIIVTDNFNVEDGEDDDQDIFVEDDGSDYFSNQDEEQLLYEFYLEHGCDSLSDSNSFEENLSDSEEAELSEDMEEKHRQILRASFNDEYRYNKRQSDISTDSPKSNGSGKKQKLPRRARKALKRERKKNKPYERKDLFRLNNDFRNFISSSSIGDSKPIAQVTKTQRRQIILLANIYGLEIISIGSKSSRILGIKYSNSTKLIDLKESKKFVRMMMQNPDLKDDKEKLSKPSNKFHIDNKIVGENSKPIASDNLGHIILKKIGWNGGGLGINEQGNQDPIKVLIKKNKKGLGY